MNIKLRVANLVKRHGTGNPFVIAQGLNIPILYLRLPESVRGFLVRPLRNRIILVNNLLSENAIRVVVCHELGHARLHSGYGYYWQPDRTYYVPSKKEREANEFAAHLISYSCDMDSTLVASIINEKRPDPKMVHRILTELVL